MMIPIFFEVSADPLNGIVHFSALVPSKIAPTIAITINSAVVVIEKAMEYGGNPIPANIIPNRKVTTEKFAISFTIEFKSSSKMHDFISNMRNSGGLLR